MALNSIESTELSRLKGTVFSGRYRLSKVIGRGANGAVFEAEDLQFPGKRAAVKLAFSIFSETEFKREARLIGQVNHENVVKVYDYGVQERIPFIAMEYLEGESLYDLLERNDHNLPSDLILQFVREVGAALASAHDKNVIHRDLKPQNVLLVDSGNVDDDGRPIKKFVLLDFGIASKTDSTSTILNQTRAGLGTPEYRSPEQLNAKDDSRFTDIYTFGVVLYELLTGRVPFPAASAAHSDLARLYAAIASSPPPRLSEVAPERAIDPAIEELVMECLDKEADGRPQSIREVRRRYLRCVERPLSLRGTGSGSLGARSRAPAAGETLGNSARPTETAPWQKSRQRSSNRVRDITLTALLTVGVLGASAFAWNTFGEKRTKPAPPPSEPSRSNEPVVAQPDLEREQSLKSEREQAIKERDEALKAKQAAEAAAKSSDATAKSSETAAKSSEAAAKSSETALKQAQAELGTIKSSQTSSKSELTSALAKAEERRASMEKERDRLQKTLETAQQELKKADADRKALEASGQKALEAARQKIVDSEWDKTALTKRLDASAKETAAALEAKTSDLNQKEQRIAKLMEDRDKLLSQIESFKTLNEGLQTENSKLRSENQQAVNDKQKALKEVARRKGNLPTRFKLVGEWKSRPSPGVIVDLKLSPDNTFKWNWIEGAENKSFTGKFVLEGTNLRLIREQDGQQMDGVVKVKGTNSFNYKLKSAEASDPGLDFVR